jgi:hypothetical protein
MMKKNIFFPAAPVTGVLIVAVSSVPLHPIRNYTGRERNHDEKIFSFLQLPSLQS